MLQKSSGSNTTRRNWYIDAVLFVGALIAAISGIYFLIFPDGGYMGGRNPYYGIQIIFDRTGWEWIHTWLSLGMVAVALVHFLFHIKWVGSTTRRVLRNLFGKQKSTMNAKGWQNVIVDGLVALSFVVCAASGVYLLLVGESRGGLAPDPMFLFSRTVWSLLHTWSGVLFISGGIMHFAIHWGWVTKVTRKVFRKAELKVQQNQTGNLVTEN